MLAISPMYKLQSIHLFPVLHLLTHTIYTANLLEQSNRNLAKTEILLRIQMRLLISLSYTFSYFPQMSLLIVSTLRHQRPMVLSKSFYMLIIIRLSHLLPALAFLDFADRQSAYPSPCLCFSLFVQHRASGLLPLFLHCRKCRA